MRHGGWILMLLSMTASGYSQEKLPQYSPRPLESGTIRSWGDAAMQNTMTALEKGFRRYHPEISFQDTLLGSATGMAGIITSTSDLSVMGRAATPNEVMGFEWVFHVKPVGVRVMNGSLQDEGKSPALTVLVSQQNPMQSISLKQLGSILGCPADAGQPVTWRMLGAKGAWAAEPIHAYLYDDQTGTGSFLQKAVLGDGDCWNWGIVREFKDEVRPGGSVYPAGRQIAEALQRDRDGLAITTLLYRTAGMKMLRVEGEGSPETLSRDTVVHGRYALTRGIYIYINRPKNKPVDPRVAEFLRYIFSSEGQAVVDRVGDFLPLDAPVALAQEKLLE